MARKKSKRRRAMRKTTRKDVLKLYSASAPDVNLEQQEFRFTLLQSRALRGQRAAASEFYVTTRKRRSGQRREQDDRRMARRLGKTLEHSRIDGLVEDAEWRDEGGESGNSIPVLRGGLTLRLPAEEDEQPDPAIREGDRIKCEVLWGGNWHEVWMMRVIKPVTSLDAGTVRCELADDAFLLTRSRVDFKFRRGKRRNVNGWRLHEIVAHVAREFGFSATCVRGRHFNKNLSRTQVSPLEIIRLAVEEERKATGRRLAIYWRNNRLYVQPPRRNPLLYVLADQITGGSIERDRKGTVATAIRVRGTSKTKVKGKTKRRNFSELIVDSGAVAQYGYIERVVPLGAVDSRRELISKGKRELADRVQTVKKLELTHTGIAFVRRFDGVLVQLPHEGYAENTGLMWVTSVAHSLSPGSYTMSLVLRVTDPHDPEKKRKEIDAARRRAARERRRVAKKEKARS